MMDELVQDVFLLENISCYRRRCERRGAELACEAGARRIGQKGAAQRA